MSSRSATVLVIFVVAIIAFCLATVFASMTGPISILPNESDTGSILDNLSAITNDTVDSDNSYRYQDYDDYSSSDSSSDDSYVETTSDDSSSSSSSSSSNVETTTDTSTTTESQTSESSSSSVSSSDVETTTDD